MFSKSGNEKISSGVRSFENRHRLEEGRSGKSPGHGRKYIMVTAIREADILIYSLMKCEKELLKKADSEQGIICTDICDGESQGTDGINYSLASREMIANMIEIHANATPFDAGVYLSSCDKGVPGNLMGLARVNIPSVFVPGGTMNAGPEMLTLRAAWNVQCTV